MSFFKHLFGGIAESASKLAEQQMQAPAQSSGKRGGKLTDKCMPCELARKQEQTRKRYGLK